MMIMCALRPTSLAPDQPARASPRENSRCATVRNGSEKLKITHTGTNEAKIAGDVLADSIVFGEAFEISKEWNLNGQKVTIGVRR